MTTTLSTSLVERSEYIMNGKEYDYGDESSDILSMVSWYSLYVVGVDGLCNT